MKQFLQIAFIFSLFLISCKSKSTQSPIDPLYAPATLFVSNPNTPLSVDQQRERLRVGTAAMPIVEDGGFVLPYTKDDLVKQNIHPDYYTYMEKYVAQLNKFIKSLNETEQMEMLKLAKKGVSLEDAILAEYVVVKDTLSLALSREDAKLMGLSDSAYNSAVDQLATINEQLRGTTGEANEMNGERGVFLIFAPYLIGYPLSEDGNQKRQLFFRQLDKVNQKYSEATLKGF